MFLFVNKYKTIRSMIEHNILIIGTVYPEPNSSAAGTRMLQLIDLFIAEKWKITFVTAASKSVFSFELEKIGVSEKKIELNNSSFDVFIKNLNPSIVIFDRYMIEEQFGWRVAEHCPNAMRILDTEDLHCLRAARQQAFKEQRTFKNADLYSDVAKREIASILRCDLSLIISEFEMNLLTTFFKIESSLLLYLPLLYDSVTENNKLNWPSFRDRKNFIFIGNFFHEPNYNCVLYLKETVFPAIKKLMPEAVIEIYGAYTSQKVLQLHNSKEGFLILGRAENALEVIGKSRVLLAPLRFGAGLKGKLIDAMIVGTPTVTSFIGAEGITSDLKWNGFVENDATAFAKAATLLYNNEEIWLKSQQHGIEIYNSRFLKTLFTTKFLATINQVLKSLETHRQHNFIGAMLQFHHSMGTKYMSKWIEEKNKIQNMN